MNIKRAAVMGILLWVLIFFEVSILMFGFSLSGASYYFVHYLLSVVLVSICAWLYFKGKVTKTVKEGFKLGLLFVAVGLVLDTAITIPLFIKTYTFFLNPYLWVSYVEGILITTLYLPVRKLFTGHY